MTATDMIVNSGIAHSCATDVAVLDGPGRGSVERRSSGDRDGASAPSTSASVSGRSSSWTSWWILAFSVSAVLASALQWALHRPGAGMFIITFTFVVCCAAAWIDVATRRIPNVLTYPAILAALALQVVLPPLLEGVGAGVAATWLGASGVRDALLGFGLCSAIGIVSFMARGLGGGDVKLLAAVGALLGVQAVVPVLFNTLVVAAVIGIANWTLRGTLVPRLQVVAGNLLVAAVTKEGLRDVYPFGRSEAPFGLALLIGLIMSQFFALHQIILSLGG